MAADTAPVLAALRLPWEKGQMMWPQAALQGHPARERMPQYCHARCRCAQVLGGCSVRRGWPWAKDEGTWVYCQLAPLGCCLTEAALEQDSPGLDEVWASCRRQG